MKKAGSTPPQEILLNTVNSTSGRLSSDTQSIQSLPEDAAKRLGTGPLHVPSEYDLQAVARSDLKLAALMCAIARIAQQRGKTITQQLDVWEAGE